MVIVFVCRSDIHIGSIRGSLLILYYLHQGGVNSAPGITRVSVGFAFVNAVIVPFDILI